MSVLDGTRRETRRVLVDGRPQDAHLDGESLVLDDGSRLEAATALHLPPVDARTIVCVHLNYRSRAEELGRPFTDDMTPTYFLKPGGAINAHGRDVARPADCQLLNYEGELAAVVGRPMHRVSASEVWDHLAGFTVANDFGVHDFRDTDSGSMVRVKGQAGFCPIGPGLVSGVDVRDSFIRTTVNDVVVQSDRVANMMWGIDQLLEDLTRHLALEPGDIVLTGTPSYSRPVFPGDVVTVEVEGVGRLANTVVESDAPRGFGFPPTVTATSLYVALGSDFPKLQDGEALPDVAEFHRQRDRLVAEHHAETQPAMPEVS